MGVSSSYRTYLVGLALLAAGCSRAPESVTAPAAPAEPTVGAFAALPSPAAAGSGEPRLSVDAAGALVMSWLEPGSVSGEVALKYARFDGERWSDPSLVASGADWVVSAADSPSVRWLGPSLVAADWRVPAASSPYAYDIRVAVSADAGGTWSESLLLNDDGTPTEHGFVSWFAARDGRAGVVWLDGRDNASEEIYAPSGAPLGTSLRYAYLGANGRLAEQGVIDDLACDCCRTDVVATASGAAIVYRDRSPEEIRDIVVRVPTAAGWSAPVTLGPDNWQIDGCPVNGPKAAASGDELAVAWFTAADGRGRVRAARSSDGGRSFGAAVDIDATAALGQVGVVLGDDGTAFVSWWQRRADGGADLALRTLARDGTLGDASVIASSASSRPDTVPQLERAGRLLVVAWNDDRESPAALKLVAAELSTTR
jgi:hypothetical protein